MRVASASLRVLAKVSDTLANAYNGLLHYVSPPAGGLVRSHCGQTRPLAGTVFLPTAHGETLTLSLSRSERLGLLIHPLCSMKVPYGRGQRF